MHVDGAMQQPQGGPGAEMARELAKMQAEFAKAQAEIAREQGRPVPGQEVVRTPAGGPPPGIRIMTPEGQEIVIDRDILSQAISGMAASAAPPPPPPDAWDGGPPDSVVAIILVSILASAAVLFPIARAIGRRVSGQPAVAALPTHDFASRLDRIENAVESIAVEVERISEGQRFTAKLLADRPDPMLVTRGMNDAR